jgi:hypothetical protein
MGDVTSVFPEDNAGVGLKQANPDENHELRLKSMGRQSVVRAT